jgi:hypothetical protein
MPFGGPVNAGVRCPGIEQPKGHEIGENNMTILSLKFLWDLFKPLLTDTAKDRLKPKTSTEIAKKRSFDFYIALKCVEQNSESLVESLQNCAKNAVAIKLGGEAIHNKVQERWLVSLDHLQQAARNMAKALADMIQTLKNINPQMEIHNPLLVKTIRHYANTRDGYLGGTMQVTENLLENEAASIYRVDVKTIQQLSIEAEMNHQLIKQAITDLRGFLAKNFSFKESF